MESYIFFMHSKSTAYFVPRLPPGLVIFQNYPFYSFFPLPYPPSASLSLPNETAPTLCRRHHQLSLTPLSGRQPPPFSLSFHSFSLLVMSKWKEKERKRERKGREEEIVGRRELWVMVGDEDDKMPPGFTTDERQQEQWVVGSGGGGDGGKPGPKGRRRDWVPLLTST